MTIGTKEDYMDRFKHILMTNNIGSSSLSLDLILEDLGREIDNRVDMHEQDKLIYSTNLEKAFKQIKKDISGGIEE